MKTTILGLLAVSFGIVILGCGGSGGGGSATSGGGGGGVTSPYRGDWSGTFQDQIPSNGSGTLRMAVDGTGSFNGSGRNNLKRADFSVRGQLSATGLVSGTMTSGSLTGQLSGQLAVDGNKLTGNVIVVASGSTSQLNVVLAR